MLGILDPARYIVTLVALVTVFGGLLADFIVPATAAQHIKNPKWPAHAKFHNGQTITLGILLGGLSLFLLWFPIGTSWSQFVIAAIIASFYWVALLCARLFPGTAWMDPEFAPPGKRPAPQLVLTLILLALLIISLLLEAWHL